MRRSTESLDDIIRDAVSRAMGSIVPAIQRQLDDAIAKRTARSSKNGARGPKRHARVRAEITRWVADRRARRVPTFVIEMTGGLDTKKKIVAKYGDNAVFEKGKPLPSSSAAAHRTAPAPAAVAARVAQAKPPVVRKAAAK